MAIRFYFDSTATPGISPAFGSGWNLTTDTIRRRLNRTPQGSTMTDGKQPGGTGDQWPTTINPAGEFSLAYQFIITGLAAQTISGTIKGQMRAAESASGANCTLAVRVAKAASDGSGVTEILAISASDNVSTRPPEFLGVLTNARFQDVSESFSLALSSTPISENDILIIEIGARSTSNALRGFSLSIGDDSGTDLPEDVSTATANNPWIEFSGDITFAGEGGGGTAIGPISNYYRMMGMR